VEARVVAQLGVEGASQHAAFADRHRVPLVASQHLDAGAVALNPGGADEDRPQRLVADPLDSEVGLEALQLPAEGVAPGRGVDEAKVVSVADDQPGAGTEDRQTGLVVGMEPRLETGRLDALGDRRALAAGDDKSVEPGEIGGNPDLRRLGAELPQGARVGLEVALDS
jgi:hypothetical protein